MQSRKKVLEKLELIPGKYCIELITQDQHIRSATKRAQESSKEARICRKMLRLEGEARSVQNEGPVYVPGGF